MMYETLTSSSRTHDGTSENTTRKTQSTFPALLELGLNDLLGLVARGLRGELHDHGLELFFVQLVEEDLFGQDGLPYEEWEDHLDNKRMRRKRGAVVCSPAMWAYAASPS